MHLVHKGMAKESIPVSLAPNLLPPSKRKVPVGGVSVLPAVSGIVGIDTVGGRSSPVVRSGSPSVKVGQVYNSLPYSPFPNKPLSLRVCRTSLLKTLWEKEKLLIQYQIML